MIGVVDGPACEPENLLFQFAQRGDAVGHDGYLYPRGRAFPTSLRPPKRASRRRETGFHPGIMR
jgi:hypothetical protein